MFMKFATSAARDVDLRIKADRWRQESGMTDAEWRTANPAYWQL